MYKSPYLIIILLVAATILSCKKDNAPSCVTCSSSQTPDFEVCEESDGNASVNGEDTGTSYAIYISGLEAAGTSCGN
ncbi:MAG: hypothetical protein ACI83B_001886 [Sediminicola sp.]|jgi:hypothetical protein|tara:strand:+ start:1094 stop:1324 length:231 start_codon:yes stop_codon:yes gene_type:complete